MIKIKIDGKELEVPAHYTLLQAAELAGAEIPRFCFHERLSVAGNCRMCLVEVKGGPPKPQASCAMSVKDLRPGPNGEPAEFFTNTPMVRKAREGALEFLLLNHPLDCPICDQGGECDLQDQAFAYGRNKSRYCEDKRAVEEKEFGPLIKTKMTRCIHCTRCVRFITEIAGVSEIGLIGRGEDAEIISYLDKAIDSELQGNLVDLCPVGALTSKPYAFVARPWELAKTETIDVMDAMGSAIRVDSRGREVMRILPRINDEINEAWISDKTRFVWDGLRLQRIDSPYRRVANNRLERVSWEQAFAAISEHFAENCGAKIGAIAGDLATVEEIYALKDLMHRLGSNFYDCRQDGAVFDPQRGRASYLFNSSIQGLEAADALLIIGADIAKEAAVLNARIRKWQKQGNYPIGIIGSSGGLTFGVRDLGNKAEILWDLYHERHAFFELLLRAERPLIILGSGASCGPLAEDVINLSLALAEKIGAIKEDWLGVSFLHHAASRVGALDLGFVLDDDSYAQKTHPAQDIVEQSDILFLLGADEIDLSNKKAFTIYIGTHGDNGAHNADIILPAAAYTEKSGLYVNMEGRVQMTQKVAFAPGQAKEDWAILRSLSAVIAQPLPYDSLAQLRAQLFKDYPHFQHIDQLPRFSPRDIEQLKNFALPQDTHRLDGYHFSCAVKDFYLSNPIARASKTLASCAALRSEEQARKAGYNGCKA